jgi:hypothetical protein
MIIKYIMSITVIILLMCIIVIMCYNGNKVLNEYYLFGLRLRFESHQPEHVVDQMNNILVQNENLFGDSSFGAVPGTTRT